MKHEIKRVRHELRARELTVKRVEHVTPKMLRIWVGGEALDGFHSPSPDDHVKISVPGDVEEVERRDFTPRRFDPAARSLAIDFALHADGPAMRWARDARPGSPLRIGGPRGSAIVPVDFDWWLLVGDESALPAIGRRVEELPAGVNVTTIVAVAGPEEEQSLETVARHEAIWVHRPLDEASDPAPLLAALARFVPPDGRRLRLDRRGGDRRTCGAHAHARGKRAPGGLVEGQRLFGCAAKPTPPNAWKHEVPQAAAGQSAAGRPTMLSDETPAATRADLPPVSRCYLIAVLGMLTMLPPLSTTMALPAGRAIAADLHVGPTVLAASLSAFFLGFGLGQLFLGTDCGPVRPARTYAVRLVSLHRRVARRGFSVERRGAHCLALRAGDRRLRSARARSGDGTRPLRTARRGRGSVYDDAHHQPRAAARAEPRRPDAAAFRLAGDFLGAGAVRPDRRDRPRHPPRIASARAAADRAVAADDAWLFRLLRRSALPLLSVIDRLLRSRLLRMAGGARSSST